MHCANESIHDRPYLDSKCCCKTSPKLPTESESPIISALGGRSARAGVFTAAAKTKEPITTINASDRKMDRIINDQSFLPGILRVSGFILNSNIRLQIDSIGIISGFHGMPDRSFNFSQLKLVGPAGTILAERLFSQADVSGMHH